MASPLFLRLAFPGLPFLAALTGCGGGDSGSEPNPAPPPPPTVAAVEVQPATAEVMVGETVQLQVTVRDDRGNALAGRTVTWSTSQGSVATVSSSGVVTGVAPGPVTITATADGRSGTASVTVTTPLPAPSCRDCLEVVPGSALLNAPGAQVQLVAYLVDAAGRRTPVNAAYSSAKPAVVTVTPGGLATAVEFGSAQVSATGGGKTSVPVVVLVATPVQGAVMVDDAMVSGLPVPVDPEAPYGAGYRYRVRLRGVEPAVGTVLIGTGALPIQGKVLASSPAGSGMTAVELEVRPMAEILPNLTLREQWTLEGGTTAQPAAARRTTLGGVRPVAVDDPLEEGQFRLGPFVCKAEAGAGVSLPLNLIVEEMDARWVIINEAVYENGAFRGLVINGEIRPRLRISPKVTGSLEASLECRATLYKPRIPIRGVLATVISPVVPIGVGFKLEGKVQLANLGYNSALHGRFAVFTGIDCRTDPCTRIWDPTHELTGSFAPILEGPVQAREELAVSGFAFARLTLTNPVADLVGEVLGESVEVKLLDAVAGLRQKLEVASPAAQVDDPEYASGADLSAFFELAGEGVLELGSLLSIKLLEQKEEGATPLASTPKGELDVSTDTVWVTTGGVPSEPVLLRATLWPVTWLGGGSVEGVEFFWKGPSGLVRACFIEPDHPGQVEFECEFFFTDAHLGAQSFHAFVQARIFGVPFATPFELAKDARVTVQVLKEPPLAITTTTLPAGQVGAPYAAQLTSMGGRGPVHWRVVAGLLPSGLGLNPATGQITGTPTESCVCEFAVEVTRGQQTASANLSITTWPASMAGQFTGTFKHLTGLQAGVVRTASGSVRTFDGGAYGNHLLAFTTVDGRGACGLMVTGDGIEAVTADRNCIYRFSLFTDFEATSWSITRDKIRITFTLVGSGVTSTAELELTRVP